jgi:hypothetical protein
VEAGDEPTICTVNMKREQIMLAWSPLSGYSMEQHAFLPPATRNLGIRMINDGPKKTAAT